MAIEHNSLARATELTRGIKRIMGLDADQQGTSRLSETLQPVIDFFSRPEWAAPRGEILFSDYRLVGAVAAQKGKIQVLFPVTTDRLAVITHVMAWTTNGNIIFQAGNAAGFGGPFIYAKNRDMRGPGGLHVAHDYTSSAGAGPGTAILGVVGTLPMWTPLDFVLYGPDTTAGLTIYAETDNVPLWAAWMGYERSILPGEQLR